LIDRASEIFATWQHDFGEVLGRSPNTLSVTEDEVGLRYVIDPPSWAERHIETIQRGDVRGSSFTFVATRVEYDWESDPNYVIRTVRQAQLFEVAPVTLPAYPQSTAGVRSEQDVAEYIKGEKARRQKQTSDYLERNRALRDILISR
jgi:HK97 family phage prohead protease